MIPNLVDRFRVEGKVAVVTGASRGIGAGIAIGLADAGAHVVLTARAEDRLAEGVIRMPLLQISSTDLRERARSGRSLRYLVPEPVRVYIEEEGVYAPPA